MSPKNILEDLIEILAEIENGLASLDYGQAREKNLQLLSKGKELLNAIDRDGHTILEAEQLVAEYVAENQSLDPAIEGALFGNPGGHDPMAAILQHWHRRRWATYLVAISAAQQSGNAALLSDS